MVFFRNLQNYTNILLKKFKQFSKSSRNRTRYCRFWVGLPPIFPSTHPPAGYGDLPGRRPLHDTIRNPRAYSIIVINDNASGNGKYNTRNRSQVRNQKLQSVIKHQCKKHQVRNQSHLSYPPITLKYPASIIHSSSPPIQLTPIQTSYNVKLSFSMTRLSFSPLPDQLPRTSISKYSFHHLDQSQLLSQIIPIYQESRVSIPPKSHQLQQAKGPNQVTI